MTNRRTFLSLGLGSLALPSLEMLSANTSSMPSRGLCAHRGAMVSHPENTLPAFEEALRLGAKMIEFDVQLTRDAALVVMHDDTINRTTNQEGRVSDLNLSDLRQVDAGIRHDPRFAGTRVPTFAEVLEMMPANVWLNCHLKGAAALGEAAAKVIRDKGRLHQAFLAAKTAAAAAAREAVPGILICNMERQSAAADYVRETIAMKADFIQLSGKGEIDRGLVNELDAAGVRVNYFEAGTPEIARKLFEVGVDFPLVNDLAAFVPLAQEIGV